MSIIDRIKIFFYKYILKREYFIGVDLAYDQDKQCWVRGYKDSKGVYHVKEIRYE